MTHLNLEELLSWLLISGRVPSQALSIQPWLNGVTT